MKKVLLILACGIAAQLSYAQATPKWAGKAKKAVFSIVTYDKDNKIKNTGNGFYINENGTALSDYTLFEGAERAVIINADSKELPVLRILGANSMYDIVKFNTETDKKTIALKSASQPASVGETVYLLPYSTQKAATCQTGTVTKVDTIGDKAYYYTLAMTTNEKTVSFVGFCGDFTFNAAKLPFDNCNLFANGKRFIVKTNTFGIQIHDEHEILHLFIGNNQHGMSGKILHIKNLDTINIMYVTSRLFGGMNKNQSTGNRNHVTLPTVLQL